MEREKPKKKSLLKRLALGAGIAAAAFMLFFCIGLGVLVARPELLWPLVQKAVAAAGGTITARDVSLSLWPASARVENLDLTLPSLSARLVHGAVYPDLRARLLGRPWIKMVEAKGLVLVVKPSKKKEKKPPGLPDLSGLKRLFDVLEARIEDCDVSIPAGDGTARVSGVSAHVWGRGEIRTLGLTARCQWQGASPGERVEGPVTATVGMNRAIAMNGFVDTDALSVSLPSFAGVVSGQAAFDMTKVVLVLNSLSVKVPSARVTLPGKAGWNGIPVELAASGRYQFDGGPSSLEITKLSAGSFLSVRGDASGSGPKDAEGRAEIAVTDVRPLLLGLDPLLPESARIADPAGAFKLRASLKKGALDLSLEPSTLSGRVAGLAVNELSASLSAKGPLAGAVALDGRIKGAFGPDSRAPKPLPVIGRVDLSIRGNAEKKGFDLAAFTGRSEAAYKGMSLVVKSGSVRLKGPWAGPYEFRQEAGSLALAPAPGQKPLLPVSADVFGLAYGAYGKDMKGAAGKGLFWVEARGDCRDCLFRGLHAALGYEAVVRRSANQALAFNGAIGFSVRPARNRGRGDDLPPVSADASLAFKAAGGRFSAEAAVKQAAAAVSGLAASGSGSLSAEGPTAGPWAVRGNLALGLRPGAGGGSPPSLTGRAAASLSGSLSRERFSVAVNLSPLEGSFKGLSGRVSGAASASGPFAGPYAVSGRLSAGLTGNLSAKAEPLPITASSGLSLSGTLSRDRVALDLSATDF